MVKISEYHIIAAGCILSAIILLFSFQITGLFFLLTLIAFITPFYLILSKFQLDIIESLVIGFFLSIGLFSALYYWVAYLFGIKLAVIICWFILMSLGVYLTLNKNIKLGHNQDHKEN